MRWADSTYLGSRAFFRINSDPPTLVVEDVKIADEGTFTCRVDYKIRPSAYTKINLTVIVPAGPPLILDDKGKEMKGRIGPLDEDTRVSLGCKSGGGTPAPQLTWWRDGRRLHKIEGDISSMAESRIVLTASRDLHGSTVSCQALNNNITEPSTTSLLINVLLRPISVEIVGPLGALSAGRPMELVCRAVGSRPPARISWVKSGKQILDVTHSVMNGGNVTTGSFIFVPKRSDHGETLTCRASNSDIPNSTIEDSIVLTVLYKPEANLSLGRPLKADNIKAGDDVYFECSIEANPPIHRVSWHQDGILLTTNKSGGLIISGRSLVLQSIERSQSGNYTCAAHNSEGQGVSNPVPLKIKFAPVCAHPSRRTQVVARAESARVSCEVEAFPANVNFTWKFNGSSSEGEALPLHSVVHSQGTLSFLNYSVQVEKDFGTLLCWASNAVGVQDEPCIVHVIPAGESETVPDPPRNCSITNQTSEALVVECYPGFDGGLPQTFFMEAWDHSKLLSNKSSQTPEFVVRGLNPGMGVTLKVSASNYRGMSTLVKLEANIMKVAEKRMGPPEKAAVPPFIGALVGGVGAVLSLILAGLLITRYAPNCSWSHNEEEDPFRSENSPSIQMTDVYVERPRIQGDKVVKKSPQRGSPDLVCETVGTENSQEFCEISRVRSPHTVHSPGCLLEAQSQPAKTLKRGTTAVVVPRYTDTVAVLQEKTSGVTLTLPEHARGTSHCDSKRRAESGINMRYRTNGSTGAKGFQQESPTSIENIPEVYFPAEIPTPAAFRDSPPPRLLLRQNSSIFPLTREEGSQSKSIDRACGRDLGERHISSSSLHDLTSVSFQEGPIPSIPCYATLGRKRVVN